MQKIIGIGEMLISNNAGDVIKTFALASCVALVVYSSVRKTGGMIHIALPSPATDEDKIKKPCYYASTGTEKIINKICSEYGCSKGELNISLYGGANSIRENDVFNIGKKNIDSVIESLLKQNLFLKNKDIGGTVSRTIELEISTGNTKVNYQPIRI